MAVQQQSMQSWPARAALNQQSFCTCRQIMIALEDLVQ